MTLERRLSALALALPLLTSPVAAQEVEFLDLGDGLMGNAYFSPYEDLDKKVLAVLDMAEPGSTVYMSYYSLSYHEYPTKFKELREKGVQVRLNLWDRELIGTYKEEMLLPLAEMDPPAVDLYPDGVIPNHRKELRPDQPVYPASMHTKITVVNEEIIITGSANLSASASLVNHEHIIILKSREIAAEFIKEWKEQRAVAKLCKEYLPDVISGGPYPEDWSGDGGTYYEFKQEVDDLDERTRNTLDNVQTYFAPDDWPKYKVRDQFARFNRTTQQFDGLVARKSIKVAMYTFVDTKIAESLVYAANNGVQVTILADEHQAHGDRSAIIFKGGEGFVGLENVPNIHIVYVENNLGNYSSLHHKYAIVDDETIIGGSFNWTGLAHHSNDENLTIIQSPVLAERFNRDFSAMQQKYEPFEKEWEAANTNGGDTLDADEIADADNVELGWADANGDGDGTLTKPEWYRHRVHRTEDGTTRVLFSIAYPHLDHKARLPHGYTLVLVGNDPALGNGNPFGGLVLRGSRSTNPNLLGSVDLPRGKVLEWHVVLRKDNATGITGIISGDSPHQSDTDADSPRVLQVAKTALPQIVQDRWQGGPPPN